MMARVQFILYQIEASLFFDCQDKFYGYVITDSALDYPGATFQWAPSETSGWRLGSHNNIAKTKKIKNGKLTISHPKWKIEGQIRKINVKSRTWDGKHIIQARTSGYRWTEL
jgi:hypothetical protein